MTFCLRMKWSLVVIFGGVGSGGGGGCSWILIDWRAQPEGWAGEGRGRSWGYIWTTTDTKTGYLKPREAVVGESRLSLSPGKRAVVVRCQLISSATSSTTSPASLLLLLFSSLLLYYFGGAWHSVGKLTLSLRRAICRAIKEINLCAKCDCSITRVQPTRPISKQAEQKSNNRDSTVGEHNGGQQGEQRENLIHRER